ncbi:hypothetical protein AAE478_002607 [Parahypoxylon ruwenzoriense]
MLLVALIFSFLAFAGHASAATWYFLRYYPASGQQFTSFSGEMTIPALPRAGVYYLWPGLQPTDNSGVYQNVLDGRSGTWWIGSGWCCSNPSLPWGSGFNTYANEKVTFDNRLDGSSWKSTLTRQSSGESVTDSFPLTDKSFNQAIFAIELNSVSWDFGPLAFSNIVIKEPSPLIAGIDKYGHRFELVQHEPRELQQRNNIFYLWSQGKR